jgi:hypothetical protein
MQKKKILSIQTSQEIYFLILAWSLIDYGIRKAQTLEASSNAGSDYMIANFEKSRFGSLD